MDDGRALRAGFLGGNNHDLLNGCVHRSTRYDPTDSKVGIMCRRIGLIPIRYPAAHETGASLTNPRTCPGIGACREQSAFMWNESPVGMSTARSGSDGRGREMPENME